MEGGACHGPQWSESTPLWAPFQLPTQLPGDLWPGKRCSEQAQKGVPPKASQLLLHRTSLFMIPCQVPSSD